MEEAPQIPGLVVQAGGIPGRGLHDFEIVPGSIPIEPPGEDELGRKCQEKEEKEKSTRRGMKRRIPRLLRRNE